MASNGKVLVTGAGGFVGSALTKELAERGYEVMGAVRSTRRLKAPLAGVDYLSVGEIDSASQWRALLSGVDVVVHCAARVHVMNESADDPLQVFREVNCTATLNLAREAASAGVRRFVFLSSIKVNGEQTDYRSAFKADDEPAPEDPYAVSKREAEDGLKSLAQTSGMEVVIVRPPLVYGPGVKGNFYHVLKLAKLPVPLPFGAIRNRRSMIYLGNLVDFIVCAMQHPRAANQTFVVSDGDDLSTSGLFRTARRLYGRKDCLVPIPSVCFWWAGRVLRKTALVQRLCGSLQVDITKTCDTLAWSPPYTVNEGLKRTIEPECN